MRLLCLANDDEDATDITLDRVADLIGEEHRSKVEHDLNRFGASWIEPHQILQSYSRPAWVATSEAVAEFLSAQGGPGCTAS